MKNNDGGPAFPRAAFACADGFSAGQDGMSLRDYIAAHATRDDARFWLDGATLELAKYRYADAMLAARDGKVPGSVE